MIETPASKGNLFLCTFGHVSKFANQERAKRPKICAKIDCPYPASQVDALAIRNVYYRGGTNVRRLIQHLLNLRYSL